MRYKKYTTPSVPIVYSNERLLQIYGSHIHVTYHLLLDHNMYSSIGSPSNYGMTFSRTPVVLLTHQTNSTGFLTSNDHVEASDKEATIETNRSHHPGSLYRANSPLRPASAEILLARDVRNIDCCSITALSLRRVMT